MPTNGMTIDSLNTVSSLTAQDEVPVWDNESSGEPTRKITAQNMANSVKSLADLPNTTEMNDAIQQSTATLVKRKYYSNAQFSSGSYTTDIPTNGNVVIAVRDSRDWDSYLAMSNNFKDYWDIRNINDASFSGQRSIFVYYIEQSNL